WNNGVEGASADPAVAAARARDVRSLLATLLVSRGTPMLAMGDELGRTQRGNNNAYAHDGELTWIDWAAADAPLANFVAALVALRRNHPALRQDRWLEGAPQDETGIPDVEWRRPDGRAMSTADWAHADLRVLVASLYVPATGERPADRVVVALNAGSAPLGVRWPAPRRGFAWRRALDTAHPSAPAADAGAGEEVAARALVVLVEVPAPATRAHRSGVDDATIGEVAAAAGIEATWWDIAGTRHEVAPDTKRALLAAMGLAVDSEDDARERLRTLARLRAATPASSAAHAYLPDSLRDGGRRFGLAAQLYALRRPGDAGIGDFSALSAAAVATARVGGALVGVSPLHALFAAERERASPYHPSDRRFLDPIYLDVERVPDLAHSPRAQATVAARRAALPASPARRDIDYTEVWRAKREVLEACFDTFEGRPRRDPLALEFAAFAAAGGEALERFARFEAIAAEHPNVPWSRWPAGLRDPAGRDVQPFAERHARAVRFACYLQWLADRQLGEAASAAHAAGLALGLYRDLAVGAAPDGAETWAQPERYARGASIGAPPDPFASGGQNWNLPPPLPHAMGADGCAAFRALLAANMRHAGALRIDHVMGLSRLFWIPDGASAAAGAYVRYPFEQLLTAVASESARARCIVVGEDLGTVPAGLRDRLAEADVLSYRVLWFERDERGFVDPARYPAKAAACVTTHDLPTIAGWWTGADIAERHALGLAGADDEGDALRARRRDKESLANAIERSGTSAPIDPDGPCDAAVVASIHGFAAATRAALVLFRADDLAGETVATNLPGTDRERPNWRLRLATGAADLWTTPAAVQTLAACAQARRTKAAG
ncbi:MAG TPA: 4-alpha-glucanotransferase, partial [Casimicrobiaceae bacterium]|nr:4-alpha-glucanotransferase [Casimicrobiaceae bacterium]